VVRTGSDVTIITYGSMVHQCVAAAQRLAEDGIECHILDLRTLKPLDIGAILEAVAHTSKALVVHAANAMAGVGAEIAAMIGEKAFEELDAPVRRLAGLDTPVPFSPPLEQAYRPDAVSIRDAVRSLAGY
jgi:2-oxoisovalerate dehydrogenase E1 component beta subunit